MNTLEELLEEKGINFKQSGKDYLIHCLNPEHDDKNPSCRIDRETGLTHCFSCGWKANIFKHFGLKSAPPSVRLKTLRTKLKKLMFDKSGLPEVSGAIPYNKPFKGISVGTLRKFGAFVVPAAVNSEEEVLTNRLVFPIKDLLGRTVVYQARHLYSNESPKYVFYPKHTAPILFPQKLTKKSPNLILVEGIFDMLNMVDKGAYNVVCTFGTSTLYKDVAAKLLQFRVQGITNIYILYDGDKAGKEAAKKVQAEINKLQYYNTEVIELPEDLDPGVLSQEYVDSIKEYIDEKT